MTGLAGAIQKHTDAVSELSNLENELNLAINTCTTAFRSNRKIYICGNGGSASDAQHLTAEFIGRFTIDRIPLPAVCLNTDTSVVTCISNDFSFQDIFSRQIQALGNEHDVLIALSTSGMSQNIINACKIAKEKRMHVISFLGKGGGEVVKISDCNILVPSSDTATIQECHIFLAHYLCGQVEKQLELL